MPPPSLPSRLTRPGASPSRGVWYVSPTGSDTTGDGSIGNPWASPYEAIWNIPNGANGDWIIYLRGGNYAIGDFFYLDRALTVPGLITPYQDEVPVFGGTDFRMYMKSSNYIVDGKGAMIFDGSGRATSIGDFPVSIQGAQNNEVCGIKVQNSFRSGVYVGSDGAERSSNIQLYNLTVFNCGNDPALDHGIYYGGANGADGGCIVNCDVRESSAYGIQVYPDADGLVIMDCVTKFNGLAGVVVSGGATLHCDNVKIWGLLTTDNAQYGVEYHVGSGGGPTGTGNELRNWYSARNGPGDLYDPYPGFAADPPQPEPRASGRPRLGLGRRLSL